MLIAEELLLLGLDPVRGTPVRHNRLELRAGLAGALVAELALEGFVDLSGNRMDAMGGTPEHPLLAAAHQLLAQSKHSRAVSQLRRIQKDLDVWSTLVDGLVLDGVLGRRVDQILSINVTRHPVLAIDKRGAVLERAAAAAFADGPFEPRTAVLLGLAAPCRLVKVIAPDAASRPHARARIRQAARQTPAVRIVKKLIASQQSG